MRVLRNLIVMSVILGLGGPAVLAQQQQPPQRRVSPFEGKGVGTPPSLPAMQPQNLDDLTDEEKEKLKKAGAAEVPTWSQFVQNWITPRPIPKETVRMIDEKYGYPHIAVAIKMEVVPTPEGEEEDPDVVWMRGIPPDDPESPLHSMWQERQAREMFYKAQKAWEEEHGEDEYFLDFRTEPLPAPFMDGIRFEEVRSGLQRRGRWQVSFDVADMNGDGIDDLVFAPPRKGEARPVILLGKGDGVYSYWKEAAWMRGVPFDYGGLTTADFDGDGNRDIALAIHFKGQYVLYGDGQGAFARAAHLPSPDPRITSRAPAAGDFNGDGRVDLAFLAEIDYDLATNQRLKGKPTMWVVLNLKDGWNVDPTYVGSGVIGDNLMAADFNADGRLDLLAASNASNYRSLVHFNTETGWQPAVHYGVLSNAYHPDVAFDERHPEEYFAVFSQFLLMGGQNEGRTGVVRYVVSREAADEIEHVEAVPRGEVVVYDDQRFDPFFRLAVGDLNGDGLTDVVAARKLGGVEVFVQTADGLFYREESPELQEERGTPFDLKLVDVNGDGRDDVILMSADKAEDSNAENVSPGGVQLWLSRPVS